jgi:hypothetical protein
MKKTRQTSVNNTRLLIAALILLVIGIFLKYFFIRQNQKNTSAETYPATLQPVKQSPLYDYPQLGIRLNKNNIAEISLAEITQNQNYIDKKGITTVSNKNLINPHNLTILDNGCSQKMEKFCLIPGSNWNQTQNIQPITLGGKPAISFFITENKYNTVLHVVQTTSEPRLEIATPVDGVDLEQAFQETLKSLEFIK